MINKCDWTLGENKPKQSQFVYFTAENAECAEVFDVMCKDSRGCN